MENNSYSGMFQCAYPNPLFRDQENCEFGVYSIFWINQNDYRKTKNWKEVEKEQLGKRSWAVNGSC